MTSRLVDTWTTAARTTAWLVERLPDAVWDAPIPEVRNRTVRDVAAHLHNARVRWIKQVWPDRIERPPHVDGRRITRAELLPALGASAEAMREMFAAIEADGGVLPDFAWRNVPRDLEHFIAYHVSHEAHHRGQIVLVARQLGHRLPVSVAAGIWQWRRLSC